MLDIVFIILEQSFMYFPLVLGAYISISLMKVPDLSIESAYVFGAILSSKLIMVLPNIPFVFKLFLIVFFSLLGGMIVGLVSSLLTQKAKIPHLLSSIMTIGLFHGINQIVLGTSNISISSKENLLEVFNFLNLYQNPEFIALSVIFIAVFTTLFFLFKTQLGYSLAIYGNNPKFFQNYGISKKFIFICGIVVANMLAGFSGYLVAQSSGFVDIGMGFGMALFCITCLILGKAVFVSKRVFSMFIPIFGLFLYFSVQQVLLKIGFNLKYFTMVQSIIVLCIIAYKMHKIYKEHGDLKIDNLGV